jgi:Protein of unknown function (DUF4199)
METSTTVKQSSPLLQYAIISSIVSLLFFVMLYLGGAEAFTSPLAFTAYLIPIVFAVIACIKAKKQNEGYLEFKEALKICFGIFVLTALTTTVFSYLLYNFIDVPFSERMVQMTIEKSQEFMQKFGVPQAEIDKAVNGMNRETLFSIGPLFKSFMYGCIVSFIISLIVAAIMKKKKPEFGA